MDTARKLAHHAFQQDGGTPPTPEQLTAGTHPDFRVFGPSDRASRTLPVEQLRDEILPLTRFAPFQQSTSWFVFDRADLCLGSVENVNILLKTLEEPRPGVHFILISSRPRALPDTVRSRCQHHSFRPGISTAQGAHGGTATQEEQKALEQHLQHWAGTTPSSSPLDPPWKTPQDMSHMLEQWLHLLWAHTTFQPTGPHPPGSVQETLDPKMLGPKLTAKLTQQLDHTLSALQRNGNMAIQTEALHHRMAQLLTGVAGAPQAPPNALLHSPRPRG